MCKNRIPKGWEEEAKKHRMTEWFEIEPEDIMAWKLLGYQFVTLEPVSFWRKDKNK